MAFPGTHTNSRSHHQHKPAGHHTGQKKSIYPSCASALALSADVCRKLGGKGVWKKSWIIITEEEVWEQHFPVPSSCQRKWGGGAFKARTLLKHHRSRLLSRIRVYFLIITWRQKKEKYAFVQHSACRWFVSSRCQCNAERIHIGVLQRMCVYFASNLLAAQVYPIQLKSTQASQPPCASTCSHTHSVPCKVEHPHFPSHWTSMTSYSQWYVALSWQQHLRHCSGSKVEWRY